MGLPESSQGCHAQEANAPGRGLKQREEYIVRREPLGLKQRAQGQRYGPE